ncbi:hypothetical protein GCM10018953_65690 [Streptosporangium nondiastaticum]|uniref:hypothetical protein n=1 Tax=Streptosporangium TaxID=2000 RepID=UPI0031F9F462
MTRDDPPSRRGAPGLADMALATPMLIMIIAFGVIGYRLYDRASQDPPIAPEKGKAGRVLFFASREGAISEATLNVSPPASGQPAARKLDIELKIRQGDSPERGRWALFLDGNIAPRDAGGRLRVPELRVTCDDLDDAVATVCDKYSGDPIKADIGIGKGGEKDVPGRYGDGLVLSGEVPDIGGQNSGRGTLLINIPVARAPVENTAAQYLIRPPVLGQESLPYFNLMALDRDDDLPGKTEWLFAEGAPGEEPSYQVVVAQRLGERLTDVAFNPRTPSDWTWTGRQTLDVEALAVRPHVQAAQQRDLFWAAVWISLSSAFLVWFLEIVTTAGRAALGARRPGGEETPRPEDGETRHQAGGETRRREDGKDHGPEGGEPEGDGPEGDGPEGDGPEGDGPEGDGPEGDEPRDEPDDDVLTPPRTPRSHGSPGARTLEAARRTLADHLALRAAGLAARPLDEVPDGDFGLLWTWWRLDPAAARGWLRAQVDGGRWPLPAVIVRLTVTGGPPERPRPGGAGGASSADGASGTDGAGGADGASPDGSLGAATDAATGFLGARYLLTAIRDELTGRSPAGAGTRTARRAVRPEPGQERG